MTVRFFLAILAALPLAGCYGLYGDDEMDRYFQRSDTITMSAGDAVRTNEVTHIINPWPYYVGDRRISTDARRVGAAVTRYSTTSAPIDQLPDLTKGNADDDKAMGETTRLPTNQNVDISGSGAGSTGVSVPVGKGD